ncbi:MAG: DUF6444 domain-containing protein [Anaerolineae bacterium]|nr:DUF6444 domain-containing protein [Anaerolineae bacterium]
MNEIREQLRQLNKEQLIDIILEMRGQIEELKAVVKTQSERIQRLEGRLAQNSQNSSKPPSSDGLKKKPAPKSLREKGKRKTGGQKGAQRCDAQNGERARSYRSASCEDLFQLSSRFKSC